MLQCLRAHINGVVGDVILVCFHLKRIHKGMECTSFFKNCSPEAVNVSVGFTGTACSVGSLLVEGNAFLLRIKLNGKSHTAVTLLVI